MRARPRRSRSAGCSSAGTAARRFLRPPGAVRRRSGTPPTASRRRSPAWRRPLSRYLLELEPERAEGRSWYGGPGAGELVEWRPVLDRAGVHACPNRVAAVYLELAVLVRALEGLADAARLDARPTARRCGPASSTCATRCSARRSTTSARSPRSSAGARAGRRLQRHPRSTLAPVPAPRITVVGSVNLDLVARCERLPRPGETVTRRDPRAVPGRQGREPGGRVRAARRRGHVRRRRRPRRVRGRGARRAARGRSRARLRETDEPTGVALIPVDAAGETTIVVSPGANAESATSSCRRTMRCSVSRRSRTRR